MNELTTLQTVLTDALVDTDYEDTPVIISAGQPAAPSEVGEDCQTRIYVFVDNLTDFNQTDQNACEVRTRLAMEYQIWTCYPEDWLDQISTEQAQAAATRLHDLMRLSWCATVAAKDAKTFGSCDWVEITPLEVQPRQGGAVSALGGVTVSYDCTAETSPSSP